MLARLECIVQASACLTPAHPSSHPPTCRCLVEAIEDVARALGLPKLMLCSTNDESVKSTWLHLGFSFTDEEEMQNKWDILHSDLVYLQNTVQMHKDVPPPPRFRPVLIKHGDYVQRTYMPLDKCRRGKRGPNANRPMLHASSQPAASNSNVTTVDVDMADMSLIPKASDGGGASNGNGNGNVRLWSDEVLQPQLQQQQQSQLQPQLQPQQGGEGQTLMQQGEGERQALMQQGEGEGQALMQQGEGERQALMQQGEGEGQALMQQGEGEGQALMQQGEGEGQVLMQQGEGEGQAQQEGGGAGAGAGAGAAAADSAAR